MANICFWYCSPQWYVRSAIAKLALVAMKHLSRNQKMNIYLLVLGYWLDDIAITVPNRTLQSFAKQIRSLAALVYLAVSLRPIPQKSNQFSYSLKVSAHDRSCWIIQTAYTLLVSLRGEWTTNLKIISKNGRSWRKRLGLLKHTALPLCW